MCLRGSRAVVSKESTAVSGLLICRLVRVRMRLWIDMFVIFAGLQYSLMQPDNSPPFLEYPLLVCAPMVNQSELPFRMLTRQYGANLCYTPMLHSKMMTTTKNYKSQHFTTCPQDRPLVAQLCGNDPEVMLKAAKMLEDQVDAIDINFGCPQDIARRGHYGSFLLEEPQLMEAIVKTLSQGIKVPLFCKIRVLKTQEKTLNIVDKIVKAGCSLLTVHGRVKEQNKDTVGSCNWDIIRKIKERVGIPVVANGGIYRYEDVKRCIQETGVDGVMSAESLLENPALFSGKIYCLDSLAAEYLKMTEVYPGADFSCIKAHLFKMLYKGLQQNTDLRDQMAKAVKVQDFRRVIGELRMRRIELENQDKFGWYLRYWKKDRDQHTPHKGILVPQ